MKKNLYFLSKQFSDFPLQSCILNWLTHRSHRCILIRVKCSCIVISVWNRNKLCIMYYPHNMVLPPFFVCSSFTFSDFLLHSPSSNNLFVFLVTVMFASKSNFQYTNIITISIRLILFVLRHYICSESKRENDWKIIHQLEFLWKIGWNKIKIKFTTTTTCRIEKSAIKCNFLNYINVS